MTTQELKQRVEWHKSGHGMYEVTITYKGKKYSCHSHNTVANDDYQSEQKSYYKTDKQCLMAFYYECRRKNQIGN